MNHWITLSLYFVCCEILKRWIFLETYSTKILDREIIEKPNSIYQGIKRGTCKNFVLLIKLITTWLTVEVMALLGSLIVLAINQTS